MRCWSVSTPAVICGTDMQILKNPPGIAAAPGVTIGHEMVGTVVKWGMEVKNFKAGEPGHR